MGKVVPITVNENTRDRLMAAAGRVLARRGFNGINADEVAAEAGVPRHVLFRYFHGLTELVDAYSRTCQFWPTVRELLGGDAERLKELTPDQQVAAFFKSYLTALRARPQTARILAWETLERNHLAEVMDYVRVRTALEYFEHLHGDIPDDIDLSAIVVVMAGAVHFLAGRSHTSRHFGGIDFTTERGWRRIDAAIDMLLKGIMDD